jgi:hypothetical protein
MSGSPDKRLDALLHDLPPAPPVAAGLAARVLAAAAATPQETRPASARRAARRDRRGKWLRRPLLAGTAALGLVFTSAVAATLAGVPIPQKIAAVFFPEEKAPEPRPVVAPRRAPRPAPAAAAPVQTAEAAPAAEAPIWSPGAGPWRRLFMAERIIAARRAMGLPTPGADRVERQLRRRAERWQAATPEQRAAWAQRQQLRQDVRRAMLATPEGRAELARQDEQMRRWRGPRQPGVAPGPEQRAERQQLVREWRARRMAGIPLSPEEQLLRRERQLWRAQGQAGRPPLTEEQQLARQERVRRWREARRARWQARAGENDPGVPAETEGPRPPAR